MDAGSWGGADLPVSWAKPPPPQKRCGRTLGLARTAVISVAQGSQPNFSHKIYDFMAKKVIFYDIL